jgi:hypothetical protein
MDHSRGLEWDLERRLRGADGKRLSKVAGVSHWLVSFSVRFER